MRTFVLTTLALGLLLVAFTPPSQAIIVCGDTQADIVPGGGVYTCMTVKTSPADVSGCTYVYVDSNANNKYDSTDPHFGPCL